MYDTAPQGFEESDTWFDVALRVAREFLKMHIISSDSDKIAIVFYGTVCSYATCRLHARLGRDAPHLSALPTALIRV